jgi:hypothetical protein
MILPAREPLEPYGRPLRALYVALNRPVVTVDPLPAGPVSAAVALHDAGASLCVRCVRTGQVQLYTTTRELASERRVALDAALSFAESMGFLFDADEVSSRGDLGAEQAALLWQELCGEAAEPESEVPILLEQAIQASPQLPPTLVLSKFRRAGSFEPVPNRDRAPDVRLRLVSRF